MEILQNRVVCPQCSTEFEHNKVNGIATVEIVQGIEQRKRVHCKLTMNAIERAYGDKTKVPATVRKAILDGYNDLSREVINTLGFGTEVE